MKIKLEDQLDKMGPRMEHILNHLIEFQNLKVVNGDAKID
jgi:hypothetical protein